MTKIRDDLLTIKDAALQAVDPGEAVRRCLRREGDQLRVGARRWPLTAATRVRLIAVGKAAPAMAGAAVEVLGEHLDAGVVVTKYDHASGYRWPEAVRVLEAGHPVPDAAGLEGARAVGQLLDDTRADDRVLVLISGGGSALLPSPVEGVALDDVQATTDLLLRAGATIVELNAVRKHLSRLKGGQLARRAAPAAVAALILSDVVGDPLDVIASGPTAPDPTTYADALAVLARYDLRERVPAAVQAHLAAGAAGDVQDTPKPGQPPFDEGDADGVHNVIVGSNRAAARAAVAAAEQRGYRSLLLTTYVEGEAREVAQVAAALAKGLRRHGDPLAPPACLVWGGETTVTVRGEGQGGRNQELALATALAMEGVPDVGLLALATDGTDGPTDAAGAIVDGRTAQAARAQGWDPRDALAANNAYPLLEAAGALLRTGPTGTNVNDLLVLLAP